MEPPEGLLTENAGNGIHVIDTLYLSRRRFACCYLFVDNGEAAVIETNTNQAVPRILSTMDRLGVQPGQVRYVFLTHIHLDHAGGAGELMRRLPRARLVLHPRGRRHLIDPGKLIESVRQVYGEEKYRELYGDILPVEKERIITAQDHQVIKVGSRELLLLESPGHARHHIVIFDRATRSLFSGDAFGLAYPRFNPDGRRLVFPSTSPTQFDPQAAKESFQKIVDLKPVRVLHTHFSTNGNIEESHRQLCDWIDFSVDITRKRYQEGYRDDALDKVLREDIWANFERKIKESRGTAVTGEEREFLALDTELNAKGLALYIQKLNS